MISTKVVKDPDHRFLWHLCKIYRKLPDDPWFEEIDPIIKAWMYNSWLEDISEKMQYAKEHGLLIGSFTNYEAVKQILSRDNPDHMMTDEEFDKLSKEILTQKSSDSVTTTTEEKPKHRRKRKLVK